MEVLYEDNSLIVINKPSGLATQTANVSQPDCVSLIRNHIKKEDPSVTKEPYVGVIHRLDQPVAGLLVFAKDKETAAALSAQVQNDIMNKHYHALVEGIVEMDETELIDWMYKDPSSSKAVIVNGSAGAPANARIQEAKLFCRTEKVLKDRNMTILSIRLVTGRFHQIRAQLSHMGYPIAGDVKYGSSTRYPHGIALIADSISFIHPATGEKVEKAVDFSFCL